jgi:hypothetical protein
MFFGASNGTKGIHNRAKLQKIDLFCDLGKQKNPIKCM